jgi:hypothetical protein
VDEAPEAAPIELPPSLWSDPDVRWLTGAHEAGGYSYLVREPYEELLWWMLMPRLLKLAGAPALDRQAIAGMATHVDSALAAAEAAGYRIDKLGGVAEEPRSESEVAVNEVPTAEEEGEALESAPAGTLAGVAGDGKKAVKR